MAPLLLPFVMYDKNYLKIYYITNKNFMSIKGMVLREISRHESMCLEDPINFLPKKRQIPLYKQKGLYYNKAVLERVRAIAEVRSFGGC